MAQRTCRVCGDEFEPRASGTPQVYCTDECRSRRRQNPGYAKCVVCGESLSDERRARGGRTCSPECRKARHQSTTLAWLAAKRGVRLCKVCGEPARSRSPYCSDGCRDSNRRIHRPYIRRYAGEGKTRPEHHLVMERALGRRLRPFEEVHHRNTVRSDNRIENLELWATPQPSGGRVEDLVEWVVDQYRDLVEARLKETQL